MSELSQNKFGHGALHWQFLAGVSALALAGAMAPPAVARDRSGDEAPVWIELGGQLSRLTNAQEVFSPPVMDNRPDIFDPSEKFEKTPLYSFDGRGAISLRAPGSHWTFNATVQYGRSRAQKLVVQNTSPEPFPFALAVGGQVLPTAEKFAFNDSNIADQHTLIDFKVGHDVGIGLFGDGGSSIVSAGVRFAQFASNTNLTLKSDPDFHFKTKYVAALHTIVPTGQVFHSYRADLAAHRNFRGAGPSLSWEASAPLSRSEDTSVTFDWSLSGAVLFGRQKVKVQHQSSIFYHPASQAGIGKMAPNFITAYPGHRTKARTVTIPNVGGSFALSFHYPDIKMSVGYRADIFFGAMDGGIDARKTYDRAFYGPFASISIGLGG